MKILEFCVSGQEVSWENPTEIVAGSKEYLYCKFNFNDDWEGKSRSFRFESGDEKYSVIENEDGYVKVPFEVIKPPYFIISCGGYEDAEFIPTVGIKIKVRENGYGEAEEDNLLESEGGAETFTAQVLEALDKSYKLLADSAKKGMPIIGDNGNWFIYDAETEEYIDTGKPSRGAGGEKGDKGDRGDRGEPGYSPVKGKDYWTVGDWDAIVSEASGIAIENAKKEIAGKQDQFDDETLEFIGNLGNVFDRVASNTLSLTQKQSKLSEEQLANIDKIPSIEQTAMGADVTASTAMSTAGNAYELASSVESMAENAAINANTAINMAGGHALSIENLQSNKQDKVEIIAELTSLLGVDFSQMYNKEIRGTIPLTVLAVIFPTEAYEADYVASVSFDSGETPTDVTYYINDDPAVPQLINWVGTDCTLDYHENDEGQLVPISKFQPSANTHYDIVFYFNGKQMIGLVNGFVPASGNVVSE